MLGGSLSSEDHEDPSSSSSDLAHYLHIPAAVRHPTPPQIFQSSPSLHLRQLLIRCAEMVVSSSSSSDNFSSAHRLLSILSANSSPYGDSTERLVHQFVKALTFRFNIPLSSNINNFPIEDTSSSLLHQSSYLTLNQITPFIRFSHLTANQAILEAIEGQPSIHILDFDIMHGVQWPPFMQALAERYSSSDNPVISGQPPLLRITATGHDMDILNKTGDRLKKFAETLGLRFQFHPVLLLSLDPNSYLLPSALSVFPDEALAVNCMFHLHKLVDDDQEIISIFLRKIKGLNPKVVTIAEREANHNSPNLLHRFVEALDHYAAVFDSLGATLPPNSQERLAVEQIWFGREIMDVVTAEGGNRIERHQRFESWEMILRSSGFSKVPLSPFALAQAKLLLRLHYPSEGYKIQFRNDASFLGWQNHPLFSISSWH